MRDHISCSGRGHLEAVEQEFLRGMTEALLNDGEMTPVEDPGGVGSRPPPHLPEKVENENMVDPPASDRFWFVAGTSKRQIWIRFAASSVFDLGAQWAVHSCRSEASNWFMHKQEASDHLTNTARLAQPCICFHSMTECTWCLGRACSQRANGCDWRGAEELLGVRGSISGLVVKPPGANFVAASQESPGQDHREQPNNPRGKCLQPPSEQACASRRRESLMGRKEGTIPPLKARGKKEVQSSSGRRSLHVPLIANTERRRALRPRRGHPRRL